MIEVLRLSISRSIPVTIVKEYCWCPMIPWIIYNYGIEPALTPSMARGIEFSRNRDISKIVSELDLPEPIRFEVFLESKALGVYGYIDIVAGSRWYIVGEAKAFRSRRWEHFKIQLYTYALIVNSCLGPVREAILIMGGDIYRWTLSDRDIAIVRDIVKRVRDVITSPEPPRISIVEEKCRYCRYRRLCVASNS